VRRKAELHAWLIGELGEGSLPCRWLQVKVRVIENNLQWSPYRSFRRDWTTDYPPKSVHHGGIQIASAATICRILISEPGASAVYLVLSHRGDGSAKIT